MKCGMRVLAVLYVDSGRMDAIKSYEKQHLVRSWALVNNIDVHV